VSNERLGRRPPRPPFSAPFFMGTETYAGSYLWRPGTIQTDAGHTLKLLERSTKDMEIAKATGSIV
jgi:hypothetical protein